MKVKSRKLLAVALGISLIGNSTPVWAMENDVSDLIAEEEMLIDEQEDDVSEEELSEVPSEEIEEFSEFSIEGMEIVESTLQLAEEDEEEDRVQMEITGGNTYGILYEDGYFDYDFSELKVTITDEGEETEYLYNSEEWIEEELEAEVALFQGQYVLQIIFGDSDTTMVLGVVKAAESATAISADETKTASVAQELPVQLYKLTTTEVGQYQISVAAEDTSSEFEVLLLDENHSIIAEKSITGTGEVAAQLPAGKEIYIIEKFAASAAVSTSVSCAEIVADLIEEDTSVMWQPGAVYRFAPSVDGIYKISGMSTKPAGFTVTGGAIQEQGVFDANKANYYWLESKNTYYLTMQAEEDDAGRFSIEMLKTGLQVNSILGLGEENEWNLTLENNMSVGELLSSLDLTIEYLAENENLLYEAVELKDSASVKGKYGKIIEIQMTDEDHEACDWSDYLVDGEAYQMKLLLDDEKIKELTVYIQIDTEINVGKDDIDQLTANMDRAKTLTVDGEALEYGEVTGDTIDSFKFTAQTAGSYSIMVSGYRSEEDDINADTEWVTVNAYAKAEYGYVLLGSRTGYSPCLSVELEAGQTCYFVLFEDEDGGYFDSVSYGTVCVKSQKAVQSVSLGELSEKWNSWEFTDQINSLKLTVTYNDDSTEQLSFKGQITRWEGEEEYQVLYAVGSYGEYFYLQMTDAENNLMSLDAYLYPIGEVNLSVLSDSYEPYCSKQISVAGIPSSTEMLGAEATKTIILPAGAYLWVRLEAPEGKYYLNVEEDLTNVNDTSDEIEEDVTEEDVTEEDVTEEPEQENKGNIVLYKNLGDSLMYAGILNEKMMLSIESEEDNYAVLIKNEEETELQLSLSLKTVKKAIAASLPETLHSVAINNLGEYLQKHVALYYPDEPEKAIYATSDWDYFYPEDGLCVFYCSTEAEDDLLLYFQANGTCTEVEEYGPGIGRWKVLVELNGEADEKIYDFQITEDSNIAGCVHTDKEITVLKKASCGAAGEQSVYCPNCKQNWTEDIPATGNHSWGEWKVKAEASIFEAEVQSAKCTVCGTEGTKVNGTKLEPKATLTADTLKMQKKQTTKKFAVTEIQNGDFVKSWTSSNKKIVTVSGNPDGTCKLTAKKLGKATISVVLESGLKKTFTVKVQKAKVKTSKITNLESSMTLKKGQKLNLNPVLNPVTSQDKISYKSKKPSIAKVNKKGVLSGVKAGKTVITVKAGKKSFKINVEVQ